MSSGIVRALLGASLSWMATAAVAEPNFEGVWRLASPTTVLTPVSGAVPFTAAGRKSYDANRALRAQGKFDDYDITLSRCSSPGVPRLMLTPMRFKVWQRQKVLTFDFEWNRAIRQINLGEPPKPDFFGHDLVPTVTGKSDGRWEGDTLVATTVNLSDRTLLDDLVPHGPDLKIVEHIRLIDANTLEDRVTVEDPDTFTRPWDAVIRYKRQPDALFAEDVCLDRLQAKQPVFPK